MAQRKYMSEFDFHMHMTHNMLLQQEDLQVAKTSGYFNEDNPCHIYFVCKRPRILICPEKFEVTNQVFKTTFKIQRKNEFEEFVVEVPNGYGTTDFKMESEYPFNSFRLYKQGELFSNGKTALLLGQLGGYVYANYLDLEVLYIGQSYGVDGARTAPDRLTSHSTLQGIYHEAIIKNPDCEIWLLLTSFERLLFMSIDGTMKLNQEESNLDKNHFEKVTNKAFNVGLEEQQAVNFTEASLIRYFQPPYNKIYKDTFPNPAHVTYAECYDLDVNSVSIEMKTEDIRLRLYSQAVEPKWMHMKDFFLHSREERKSMFDYSKHDGQIGSYLED